MDRIIVGFHSVYPTFQLPGALSIELSVRYPLSFKERKGEDGLRKTR